LKRREIGDTSGVSLDRPRGAVAEDQILDHVAAERSHRAERTSYRRLRDPRIGTLSQRNLASPTALEDLSVLIRLRRFEQQQAGEEE